MCFMSTPVFNVCVDVFPVESNEAFFVLLGRVLFVFLLVWLRSAQMQFLMWEQPSVLRHIPNILLSVQCDIHFDHL